MLDGYNREELIHIVDMYNLNIDMETLKKSKKEIMKEMVKVPKKTFKDTPLPKKTEIKDMVSKDKAKKSSLINKVKKSKAPPQKNKIDNYVKPK
tara:strand:- start:360 stop:641 length:282 start_codon:yes stop_codon:yes gene_type:complete